MESGFINIAQWRPLLIPKVDPPFCNQNLVLCSKSLFTVSLSLVSPICYLATSVVEFIVYSVVAQCFFMSFVFPFCFSLFLFFQYSSISNWHYQCLLSFIHIQCLTHISFLPPFVLMYRSSVFVCGWWIPCIIKSFFSFLFNSFIFSIYSPQNSSSIPHYWDCSWVYCQNYIFNIQLWNQ